MPKVYKVKKCRKSPGSCGKCATVIEKGQPYTYWQFAYCGPSIRCSKPECQPKAADLTRSEFWGQIYTLQERTFDCETTEDFESERDEVAGELQNIASECEDKLSNMPDGLQQGPTGEQLQGRADACNDAASELENIDCSIEELEKEEKETDEAFEERKKEHLEEECSRIAGELQDALSNISCD